MLKIFACVGGLAWLSPAQAQQFPLRATSYESFGLSQRCFEALNTTLSCSHRLASHIKSESPRVDVLDADGIEAICTASCKESLIDLRTKIQNDCDPATDVFDHDLALYPGEWRNETDEAPRECDDCVLGPMQIEVNSPIGHSESRAAEFELVVSSCGVTGYSYTSPSPYILSPAAPSSEVVSPTAVAQSWSAQRMSSECAASYHVQDGDTCDSIAEAHSVPSRELLEANDHLDNWCGGIQVGQDLCLPAQCNLHLVTPDDSCDSVTAEYGVSIDNLSEWNPKIYIQCDGFNKTISGFICVGGVLERPPVLSGKSFKVPTNSTLRANATFHVTTLSSAETSDRLQTASITPSIQSSASESSSRTLIGMAQNEEATDTVLSSTTTELRDSPESTIPTMVVADD
ncbi:LysM domain-containing protein [Colletotrichum fructicola Nara gc5]|uniref:LysM domain-containing protein n=1 Tax=Colletotrichum fructicola (strain Nara gc5) TaxID=1213859 RepID=A0A7J6JHY3_COLFN|nr:LysM domain-containing protein [Colletotrichum fructicola Nara gc5]